MKSKTISQHDIFLIITKREAVRIAHEEFKKKEADLLTTEEILRRQLQKGWVVEKGKHTAEVTIFERVYLQYKALCEKHLGLKFLEKMRKKAKPRKYPKLRIDGEVFTLSTGFDKEE